MHAYIEKLENYVIRYNKRERLGIMSPMYVQLYEVYPGLDVEYGVSASVPPSLRLSPGQASLVGEMETTLSVLEAGQSHLAFSLTVVSVAIGVSVILKACQSIKCFIRLQ